jgi:hypothetical protein
MALAILCGWAVAQTDPSGPLGLPSAASLEGRLTLSGDQIAKVKSVYEDYREKAREIESRGDEALKSAMRGEIISKLKEVCTGLQKRKLEELVADRK